MQITQFEYSKFFILHLATPRAVFEFLVHSTASACVYVPLNHSYQSLTVIWHLPLYCFLFHFNQHGSSFKPRILSLKWLSLSKLQKKIQTPPLQAGLQDELFSASEMLVSSIQVSSQSTLPKILFKHSWQSRSQEEERPWERCWQSWLFH